MAKGKIIVVGGNQTGLAAAIFTAREGFDVTLYEAKQKDEIAYDWTDDMSNKTFEQVGLPEPPTDIYERKRCWSFLPPDKAVEVFAFQPEDELDYGVYRRPFNNWLEGFALEAGAKVNYGVKVKSLNITGSKVTGVTLENGEVVNADLVVDCAGVDSPLRRSLPDYFRIPQECDPMCTFSVRRTFYNRPEGTERPEYTNRAYFKHLGEDGLSWVLLSHDETMADVLVGRVGEMSDETYDRAVEDLRKDNPIIGNEVKIGGELLKIPVRRPISRMFADGYVLMGDSAYMTIPIMGSGIAAGIRAAKWLSEVLANPVGKPFGSRNLYRYQLIFMHKLGASFAGIDVMKNWLLNVSTDDLNFLFSSGVLNGNLMSKGASGSMLSLSIPEMLLTGLRGMGNPSIMAQLGFLILKMDKVSKIAADMPLVYFPDKFLDWQLKYDSLF